MKKVETVEFHDARIATVQIEPTVVVLHFGHLSVFHRIDQTRLSGWSYAGTLRLEEVQHTSCALRGGERFALVVEGTVTTSESIFSELTLLVAHEMVSVSAIALEIAGGDRIVVNAKRAVLTLSRGRNMGEVWEE